MTVSFLAGDNMALININYESKTLGMPVMINAIIPGVGAQLNDFRAHTKM